MATLDENSVDSCVTDPPYHLTSVVKRFGKKNSAPAKFGTDGAYARASKGFMGKEWDGGDVSFNPETWAAVLRVLKPGGHLIAFSATRNYHRMACAIEDAGFEIRDQLAWMYGSGMPKSHNQKDDWEGWGSALKPAWEPIVLARKPFKGSIKENLETWGVGVLNINGCRVETSDDIKVHSRSAAAAKSKGIYGDSKAQDTHKGKGQELGRWPANILHDGSDDVVTAFPDSKGQQGDVRGSEPSKPTDGVCYGEFAERREFKSRKDSGSAARFFYCAKASKSDRNAGAENIHPTVKPTELMRYLCRLVTPPGGRVLDPFMGSGSTGRGALLEGFRFAGIEMDAEYMKIAEARIRDVTDGKIRVVEADDTTKFDALPASLRDLLGDDTVIQTKRQRDMSELLG